MKNTRMTLQSFYQRYSIVLLLIALCSVPVLLYGARGALQNANNDVRQWLPAGFEETRRYDWFLEKFGSEEMIVASWSGCTLEDPRLEQFAAALTPYLQTDQDQASPADQQYFRRVITGTGALRELTSEPVSLPAEEAKRRLQGVLLGPDGQTSGAVITMSPFGAADRHAALDVVYATAQQAGIAREQLHLGGPTVDSVALDSESGRSRYLLSTLSVIVSLLLAWRCLRQARLVAMVFATSLLCAMASIAIVHFTGNSMSLLMVMMPTMVYVLAISAAIHLTTHYRDALEEVGPRKAPSRAVRSVWLPCTLAALTTAIGLGSLSLSEVLPVKMFGIYAAIGVIISVPIVLLMLPAAWQRWPAAPSNRREDELPLATGKLSKLKSASCSFVIRHYRAVVALNMLLLIFLGAGMWRLETSVKLLNLFSPQSRIIQDYAWLEENLGPLVPVEVVVHFDEAEDLPKLEQMGLVTQIKQRIGQIDKVGGALSAATFVPEPPQGFGMRRTIRRAMIENNLSNTATNGSQYLQSDQEGQLWRISARVEALNSLDYGIFIAELQEQVEPIVQAAGVPGLQVTYTGIVPLLYKAQRLLLNDLTNSFASAFLLIALVMMVMLRGMKAGLVSMLPNILPAVFIFGGMGWLGRVCDIGSMMTASVAMGIAVDGTVHFLSRFRSASARGLSRADAIQHAYQHCAPAVFQATLICSLGLAVFAFSSFVPTSRFAYMMGALLGAGLFADLVFLPALLASPLGRFFEKQQSNATTSLEPAYAQLPSSLPEVPFALGTKAIG